MENNMSDVSKKDPGYFSSISGMWDRLRVQATTFRVVTASIATPTELESDDYQDPVRKDLDERLKGFDSAEAKVVRSVNNGLDNHGYALSQEASDVILDDVTKTMGSKHHDYNDIIGDYQRQKDIAEAFRKDGETAGSMLHQMNGYAIYGRGYFQAFGDHTGVSQEDYITATVYGASSSSAFKKNS